MPARLKWSKESHKRKYENDWVVDILPGNESYDLGYDYHECGICKLCQDEGCPDLAAYLCSYLCQARLGCIRIVDVWGIAQKLKSLQLRISTCLFMDIGDLLHRICLRMLSGYDLFAGCFI